MPGSYFGWLVLVTGISFVLSLLAVIILDPGQWQRDGRLMVGGTAAGAVVVSLYFLGRWLLCWRNFKRFMFGVACLVTLIAVFYAEENWRGRHAWDKFKQEWEAKGEKFNFDDFVPPPVPDDQNFAKAPVFDATDKLANRKWRDEHRNQHPEQGGGGWDVNLVDPLDINLGPEPWPTNGVGDWRRAEGRRLEPWQAYYRDLALKTNTYPVSAQPQTPAQDVLLALSRFDPVIQQLRQAGQRPASRFPLDYDDEDPAEILLPHLAALKRCSQILQLRAIAELQNGQADQALADVKLNLRLIDSMRTEPFIITHLVRIAMLQITLQPVWEGLKDHRWSDAQLAELDSEFGNFNFPADYKFSIRGERVMHIKILDWIERKRSRYWLLFNVMDSDSRNEMNSFFTAVKIYLMPRGWYCQSELAIAQLDQQWILPAADDERQTISPELIKQAREAVDATTHASGCDIFARLLVPSMEAYAKKAAYAQNSVNLARTAFALERYRLAHTGYPDSLDALVPRFAAHLPHDIIGGQSLKYRREAGDRFILYSVGWNEKDDGGTVAFKESSSGQPKDKEPLPVDLDAGDWVWTYWPK